VSFTLQKGERHAKTNYRQGDWALTFALMLARQLNKFYRTPHTAEGLHCKQPLF